MKANEVYPLDGQRITVGINNDGLVETDLGKVQFALNPKTARLLGQTLLRVAADAIYQAQAERSGD